MGLRRTARLRQDLPADGDRDRLRWQAGHAEPSFTTVKPARQLSVSVNLTEGETVGVGMPLIFTFSGSVADRAAAEKALELTAEPATEQSPARSVTSSSRSPTVNPTR